MPTTSDSRKNDRRWTPRLPRPAYSLLLFIVGLVALATMTPINRTRASSKDDRDVVAALDREYQAAVKNNDAATMERILADDFVLVTGSGKIYTKADMLADARSGDQYEHNEEETQVVRVWDDTAVVTAKLWERYTNAGRSYDHRFWFSDVYVRTPHGWKYVFGQSSTPMSSNP